ncbi:MAG: hypothetical protein CTY15_08095 [Methylocystis sp.]|nr:MAG: hypothetical protein CTY15_08095 [Methylocystis sp.]
MSLRPVPAASNRFARARASISLGAAFALFCVVLVGYEPAASQAGFLDEIFGPTQSPRALTYNGLYDRSAPRAERRHARRIHRRDQQQARRHVSERHKLASLDRRLDQRRAEADARRTARLRAAGEDSAPRVMRVAANDAAARAVNDRFLVTRQVSENADRRTYCVRSCDGYHFQALPISKDSDIPSQQAECERLCPGTESVLFVAPSGAQGVQEAKSARNGETYAQLVARINPADASTKACSCQTEASAKASTNALLSDPTLRPGDTVVTPQGVKVVRRGSHYPFRATDFLSLADTREAPVSNRSALYAIERALKTPQGRLAVANVERRRHGRRDGL